MPYCLYGVVDVRCRWIIRMRDTTLIWPEMHMESDAACFYKKDHVCWENVTDPTGGPSSNYDVIILRNNSQKSLCGNICDRPKE